MRSIIHVNAALGLILAAAAPGALGAAQTSVPGVCRGPQLLGVTPSRVEVDGHHQSSIPKIQYDADSPRPAAGEWGLPLTLRIDERGRVVCYSIRQEFHQEIKLNDKRRALLGGLTSWLYVPFRRDGNAVAAIVDEDIYEEAVPRHHVDFPTDITLDDVQITLDRSECYGACPDYRVDLHGDGSAVYQGRSYTNVVGEHPYRIASDAVARLLESARQKNLWSMDEAYEGPVTDHPTSVVTIQIGKDIHRISNYVGALVGMPRAVSEFEHEIDDAAQSQAWIHLGAAAVNHLQREGLNFGSTTAAEILLRSAADERADEEAVATLVELGAPWWMQVKVHMPYRNTPDTVLEAALFTRQAKAVEALIDRGALRVDGSVDRTKLDAAFNAAIRGGRLDLVQMIWNVDAAQPPSLTFLDVADDAKAPPKPAPVTLLLKHSPYERSPWEGYAIVTWLLAKGCDVQAHGADGRTLLHIAAEAGDVPLVRYLLAQGVPVSTRGQFDLPALGSASDEGVALVLLEAGSDFNMMNVRNFRRYATDNHWQRVVAWLDRRGR